MTLPRKWITTGARLPMALLAACFWVTVHADFFVAPSGSDTAPGTRAHPWATPERARDAVREVIRQGRVPRHGLTVWFRGGVYARDQALELTDSDSGTATAPIHWQAWRQEKPRWQGGRTLSGFTLLTDPSVLQRLPEAARGRVWQLDLRARGILNYGEMKSRGFGRAVAPAHCELFFQDRPMTLARWPNEGAFERLAGFPDDAGKGDDHGGKIGDLPGGFLYPGDRPRRWQDPTNIWVHGYWAWDWANSYERIAELDLTRRLIRTAVPHGLYGFRTGQRFYYLNILEELDQPGEWYLDHSRGMLYFWPPSVAGDPAKNEVVLSTLEQPLIRCSAASHLVIRGLTLEATRGNGIEIRDGTNVRVVGCLLRNLGNSGVTVERGLGHGVAGCEILDTGDGGVSLSGGDRQTLQSGAHFVEDCHFQRGGRWSKCYVPAVSLTGVGLRASHNHIHDLPHCGILFWGNDHLIEFNDIHHVALETGDVGAIYTGRDYSFRGNRIRSNYIHETGGVGMGSMGVYMDDCVSGTEISGNVFYRVHWAMFIGGGRDHHVENNLFVDCDPAVRIDGRGLDQAPVWHGMVDGFMRQQLAAVPAALYRERYPELKSLDRYYGAPGGPSITGPSFAGIPPEGNTLHRNVCLGKWLDTGWHARPEHLDQRDNLTEALPGAMPGSPVALGLKRANRGAVPGFQRIRFSEMGPRRRK